MLRAELASSEQQWFEESEDLKAAAAGQEQVIAKQRLEIEQMREQQAALHAKNKALGQQLVLLQQERTQFQFQLEEGSAQASTTEQQLREALRAGGEQVRQLQGSEQRLVEESQALQAKVCTGIEWLAPCALVLLLADVVRWCIAHDCLTLCYTVRRLQTWRCLSWRRLFLALGKSWHRSRTRCPP